MNLSVSPFGKYHLINVDDYSAFSMARVSIESEESNIQQNYEKAIASGSIKSFHNSLSLKKVEGLTGYSLNIVKKGNDFYFDLPITHNRRTRIELSLVSNKRKKCYKDYEKYNFYEVRDKIEVLDSNQGFGAYSIQGLLLVPIEEDADKYIENFIVDCIYEKYYNDVVDRFDNFLFTPLVIRREYPFYPALLSLKLPC